MCTQYASCVVFLCCCFVNNLSTANQQMASLTFHFVFISTDSTFYFDSTFNNKTADY